MLINVIEGKRSVVTILLYEVAGIIASNLSVTPRILGVHCWLGRDFVRGAPVVSFLFVFPAAAAASDEFIDEVLAKLGDGQEACAEKQSQVATEHGYS